MNCLNNGKRPIAFTKIDAYAGIIEPLDEAKKMKHRCVQLAPLWLAQRSHRTASTDQVVLLSRNICQGHFSVKVP